MNNESIKEVFDFVRDMRTKSYHDLRFMPYREQLNTNEWKYFRLYVIIAKGFKCELCDDKNFKHFQVHHKRYIDGKMAWEYELKDLMVLCGFHHQKVHMPEISEKFNNVKSIKEIIG
jgi:5-methylcytosine-specific restriction endonuclease McrA